MSSLDRDQGHLVLTLGELKAFGGLASGRDAQPEDLVALRNVGVLDGSDQPAADVKQLATAIATAESQYTYTSVEAGRVNGYGLWVSEDALVGHCLPSGDAADATTLGEVLFAPRDRLPAVLLTLADIPPRGTEPSELPTIDGHALWAWLRDDRISAPKGELPAGRIIKMIRHSGNQRVWASCLIHDCEITRVTEQFAADAVYLEVTTSLALVQDLLTWAASKPRCVSSPASPVTRGVS